MSNTNETISQLETELSAANLAAADLFPGVDVSAEETVKMKAVSLALGLSKLLHFNDTGSVDALIISSGLSLSALPSKMAFILIPANSNTGPCTLAFDSVSAAAIKVIDSFGTRDLIAGELPQGGLVQLSWNGTNYILMTQAIKSKRLEISLSQSGSSDPVGTDLLNDIGSITFSRTSEGIFTVVHAGAFSAGKTKINYTNLMSVAGVSWTDANTLTITTDGDGILNNHNLSVEVFL